MSSKKVKPLQKTQQDFPVIQSILFFFMILVAMMVGANFLKDDLAIIMKWWAGILVIGLAFLPLASLIFSRFHDGGYVIGKAIGIAVSSWMVWWLSTFKIAKFNQVTIIVVIIVCALVNYGLYFFFKLKNKKKPFEEMTINRISYMVFFEALFLLAFMLLCYVKSFKVTISSDTEKYMDFGFLASIMNTDYMPPKDMWFAGESINYYYYGIYVAGFLSKLCGTHAGFGYNLDLMTIGALGGCQVYSLVMELVYHGSFEHEKRVGAKSGVATELFRTLVMNVGGLIGCLAVVIAGNGHYILYGNVFPAIGKVFKLEMVSSYYFPNSTRYIQDGTGDAAAYLIHEFPAYSFVLGDLHAHVTDIMFVVAIMAILFAFHLSRKEKMDAARTKGIFADYTFKSSEAVNGVKTYWSEMLNPCIIVAAFFVGIFKITNFWDFPIYFVVSGAMILFSNAVICGFNIKSIILTAVHAVEFLVISTLVALPFTLHFTSMTSGIRLAEYHSSPFKLFVLWGLPILVCIGLFNVAINNYRADLALVPEPQKKGKVIKETPDALPIIRMKNKDNNHLFSFIFRLENTDLFVLTLAACAMGLVLMPELIYVKDIYGGTYQRSNTMFKLVYQAFIMFGIVMGYGLTRLIAYNETKKQRNLSLIALFFLLWTFGYFNNSATSYMGDLHDPMKDGLNRTLNSYAKVYDAERGWSTEGGAKAVDQVVLWALDNIPSDAVILQNWTTAYKSFATISAYTGNPTVLGWKNHQWLWRSNGDLDEWGSISCPESVINRCSDVVSIYTGTNEAEVSALIEKYNIDYIYLGVTERMHGTPLGSAQYQSNDVVYMNAHYTPMNTNYTLLKSLGEIVYDGETKTTLGYDTLIIKVDRSKTAEMAKSAAQG